MGPGMSRVGLSKAQRRELCVYQLIQIGQSVSSCLSVEACKKTPPSHPVYVCAYVCLLHAQAVEAEGVGLVKTADVRCQA